MTNDEKAKWFDVAVKFVLDKDIFLVMKSKKSGVANWAISNTKSGQLLNSNLTWEPEPRVSNRDESFKIRTRFSFDMAVQLYQQYKMFGEG